MHAAVWIYAYLPYLLVHIITNSCITFLSFNIDSNGVITTTAALDYEAQDQYRVVVFARDDGVPGL